MLVQSDPTISQLRSHSIQIIEMVQQTWQEYPFQKIDRIFVTLMSIFNSIIGHYGDNFFKIAHILIRIRWSEKALLPRELQMLAEAIRIAEQLQKRR